MSFDDDLNTLLDNTQQFLKQHADLYGDPMLESNSLDPSAKEQSNNSENHASPLKNNPPMPKKIEKDLFGNAVVTPAPKNFQAYPVESWTSAVSISELDQKINTCTKCGLGTTRTKFVFGVGNPKAEVVVVGEAPGADEDAQGEPFVGRGGQLLNKILESIKFKREEVFICNILKCRPPNNRDPQPEEIELCEPYLWKQLELIHPKMILCVGRIAGQSLLKTNSSLANLRGKVHDYRGIPLMVTYHPAALLRNPNWKRPCWEDVQQFRKLYEELKAQKS